LGFGVWGERFRIWSLGLSYESCGVLSVRCRA